MLALTLAGAAGVGAGLGFALVNRRALLRPPDPVPPTAERVAVCVPARDEARRLPGLLADLRAQVGVDVLRVWVLDDGSTDATAAAAQHAAGDDPRVVVVRGDGVLPAGRLGKPTACARLAGLAGDAEVLVFVDADVRLAPTAVAAGVALLRGHHLDLVCPWPRQVAVTPVERLVQPLQQWSWFASLPLPVAQRSRRPSMAAACGQLLVLDAAAYHRAGGHDAVAGEVLEDLALTRAVRRAGALAAPAAGAGLAACRMCAAAAALRAGLGRSLWAAFGSPAQALSLGAALLVVGLLAELAAAAGRGPVRRWGLLGAGASLAGRVVAAGATGDRAWPDALAHPFGVLAVLGLTVDSHRSRRRGTLRWRGRAVG
ncbi:glycosyltransferase [Rhodococcus aerolatus]